MMHRLICVAAISMSWSFAADVCGTCHPLQAVPHRATGMARALEPAAKGQILASHAKLTFKQGPYLYVIERNGDQSVYRVSDGKSEVRANIGWAFGLGSAGQTYVFERNGVWLESRVSYYKDIDNLDLTVGARPDVPQNLDEAVGRELSMKGARECFNCHSTGALTSGALHTETLTPGVQCQRCHEKSDEH